MNKKLYAERDIVEQGDHYVNHVSAMTGEQLHGKAAIAAELAHRDIEIERLQSERDSVKALIKLHDGGHFDEGSAAKTLASIREALSNE